MNKNYHMHTTRCNHASGTDEEYILAAMEAGFTEIGFTDHSCWIPKENETPRIRMKPEQLQEYVMSLRALRDKYKGQINILIGLECEYFEDRMEWLKDQIDLYELDYIILGNHFHEVDHFDYYYGRYENKSQLLIDYLEDSIKAMQTNLYTIFAHPDLFMRGYQKWDKDVEEMSRKLCISAKENDVILEYNLGGLRGVIGGDTFYPYDKFWEIAKEVGCKAIIGIDAHSPKDYFDFENEKKAEDYLNALGIEMVSNVKFKNIQRISK